MQVRHIPPQHDPLAGSFDASAWCYRTEVHNPFDFPIRIVWFEAYVRFDGHWWGGNVRNKVLREVDFSAWYGDNGDDSDENDAWIQPGCTKACDPNWHFAQEEDEGPGELKWSFIAVDARGNSYFDEAEVTAEAARFFTQES